MFLTGRILKFVQQKGQVSEPSRSSKHEHLSRAGFSSVDAADQSLCGRERFRQHSLHASRKRKRRFRTPNSMTGVVAVGLRVLRGHITTGTVPHVRQ